MLNKPGDTNEQVPVQHSADSNQSADKDSDSDDSTDDEVLAALDSEGSRDESTDLENEEHSDSGSMYVDEDEHIENLVHVTRSGRSVWSWRSSAYRCKYLNFANVLFLMYLNTNISSNNLLLNF